MKLVIERDHALKALTRVQGAVKARGKDVAAIWGHVKLEAGATTLCMTTGNGDQQASDSVPADVTAPGATTVDARRLHDLVRAFPSGGQVLLEIGEGGSRLIVKCGRTRSLLPTLPAEDFPQFASLGRASGGEIEAPELKRLLHRAGFVRGELETRPIWSGVFLHLVERDGDVWLTAVGTDGKCLAMAETRAPVGFEAFPAIILPGAAVDEFQRLLGEANGPVDLMASATLAELGCGTAEYTTKLVEGPFTDQYAQAIPHDNPWVTEIDVDLFQACLNRALLAADDKFRTVRLGLEPGSLTVTGLSTDSASEICDQIDFDYGGPPASIAFNGKRLKEVLGVIVGENAVISWAAKPAEGTVLVRDSGDPACRYLIIPQRGSS